MEAEAASTSVAQEEGPQAAERNSGGNTMDNQFNRAAESLGNVTFLEHLNVEIPNQGLASDFYLLGCGFTRDPYLFPGTNNMWVNIGKSQIHMPSGEALVFRGHIGVVTPNREELLNRLQGVKKQLEGTKFKFKEHNDHVRATCPWGNKFRLYEPDVERFGKINLGIPYVEFTVPPDTAAGICRFYKEVLGAHSDRCQYRFEDIVDLDTGKVLFTIEHEVRSMTHPLYARPLVNRNPAQTNRNYIWGGDSWVYSLPDTVGPSGRQADPLKAPKAPTIAKRRALRAQQAGAV
jgi:hypothetical protein